MLADSFVVKVALRRAELRNLYFAVTKDAVDYLQEHTTIDEVDYLVHADVAVELLFLALPATLRSCAQGDAHDW